MMKKALLISFCFVVIAAIASEGPTNTLFGQWKGIKMFQDQDSYDGKTFFLPNEGEMILDENSIRVYYYPYFKSADFKVSYTNESIFYKINDKEMRCDYSFKGDTLIFKMFYINKVFVKMFHRTEMNRYVIADLDQYGFRTEKLIHEFEIDTLHKEQRKGFTSYDSLGFSPYQFLEFKGDNMLIINRKDNVTYSKEYKKIKFSYNGVITELEVVHVGGTQDIFLKPVTACQCDSITLPYMSVNWANRIRQAIIDEENF